jgi:hypothetical protein
MAQPLLEETTCWSPEQISGWLWEQGVKLSHERIYQMITGQTRILPNFASILPLRRPIFLYSFSGPHSVVAAHRRVTAERDNNMDLGP